MEESKKELKSLLMRVKEETERAGLKHNINKTKNMASGPITSWQIEGERVETVTDFIFLVKITVYGDCSHEINRRVLLGRKAMIFPVVTYGCALDYKESCHRIIDAFDLWCWRRLLRVPWTARRSNQSILKEISPEYSLEGLMLKLKLQYFSHLM